jgi:hypothetical protein
VVVPWVRLELPSTPRQSIPVTHEIFGKAFVIRSTPTAGAAALAIRVAAAGWVMAAAGTVEPSTAASATSPEMAILYTEISPAMISDLDSRLGGRCARTPRA